MKKRFEVELSEEIGVNGQTKKASELLHNWRDRCFFTHSRDQARDQLQKEVASVEEVDTEEVDVSDVELEHVPLPYGQKRQ